MRHAPKDRDWRTLAMRSFRILWILVALLAFQQTVWASTPAPTPTSVPTAVIVNIPLTVNDLGGGEHSILVGSALSQRGLMVLQAALSQYPANQISLVRSVSVSQGSPINVMPSLAGSPIIIVPGLPLPTADGMLLRVPNVTGFAADTANFIIPYGMGQVVFRNLTPDQNADWPNTIQTADSTISHFSFWHDSYGGWATNSLNRVQEAIQTNNSTVLSGLLYMAGLFADPNTGQVPIYNPDGWSAMSRFTWDQNGISFGHPAQPDLFVFHVSADNKIYMVTINGVAYDFSQSPISISQAMLTKFGRNSLTALLTATVIPAPTSASVALDTSPTPNPDAVDPTPTPSAGVADPNAPLVPGSADPTATPSPAT